MVEQAPLNQLESDASESKAAIDNFFKHLNNTQREYYSHMLWTSKLNSMLDQLISILKRFNVEVCDFTTEWADDMEAAFQDDALSTANDSFIKKLQEYLPFEYRIQVPVEEYFPSTYFSYVDLIFTKNQQFFNEVNDVISKEIAKLLITYTDKFHDIDVQIMKNIEEVTGELETLVSLSVKIRTTGEQIIQMKTNITLGENEKKTEVKCSNQAN